MVKSGISPEINAVSTMLLVATALLLFAAFLLEQGRSLRARGGARAGRPRSCSAPRSSLPAAPAAGDGKVLNLFIWSNYIAPETLAKFEERHGVKVNVDLYDSNEALLAKLQAGNAGYDVVCPSDYSVAGPRRAGPPAPARPLGAAAPRERRSRRSSTGPTTRATATRCRTSGARRGIAYDRTKVAAPVDSWAALWDPRYRGRILMLDDAREAFRRRLKWRGHSLNTTDRRLLLEARDLLIRQKPLVRAYNSSNFEDVLLSGDVWLAQGWNGQFAKAMDQDPDIVYVIPKEGATLFIDNLAIPAGARHPELAHAFIDFTLEADIAAEICRDDAVLEPEPRGVAAAPGRDPAEPRPSSRPPTSSAASS